MRAYLNRISLVSIEHRFGMLLLHRYSSHLVLVSVYSLLYRLTISSITTVIGRRICFVDWISLTSIIQTGMRSSPVQSIVQRQFFQVLLSSQRLVIWLLFRIKQSNKSLKIKASAVLFCVKIFQLIILGSELVFIVYPHTIALMNWSTIWAILFFFMVITLGIDSTVSSSVFSLNSRIFVTNV